MQLVDFIPPGFGMEQAHRITIEVLIEINLAPVERVADFIARLATLAPKPSVNGMGAPGKPVKTAWHEPLRASIQE